MSKLTRAETESVIHAIGVLDSFHRELLPKSYHACFDEYLCVLHEAAVDSTPLDLFTIPPA